MQAVRVSEFNLVYYRAESGLNGEKKSSSLKICLIFLIVFKDNHTHYDYITSLIEIIPVVGQPSSSEPWIQSL